MAGCQKPANENCAQHVKEMQSWWWCNRNMDNMGPFNVLGWLMSSFLFHFDDQSFYRLYVLHHSQTVNVCHMILNVGFGYTILCTCVFYLLICCLVSSGILIRTLISVTRGALSCFSVWHLHKTFQQECEWRYFPWCFTLLQACWQNVLNLLD